MPYRMQLTDSTYFVYAQSNGSSEVIDSWTTDDYESVRDYALRLKKIYAHVFIRKEFTYEIED